MFSMKLSFLNSSPFLIWAIFPVEWIRIMVKGVQNRRNSRWSLPVHGNVETTWNLITVPCLFSNETRHPWNVNAAFSFCHVLANLHVSSLPWTSFERYRIPFTFISLIFLLILSYDSSLFIYLLLKRLFSFIYRTHWLFKEYVRIQNIFQWCLNAFGNNYFYNFQTNFRILDRDRVLDDIVFFYIKT